jgi:hypothetical protein
MYKRFDVIPAIQFTAQNNNNNKYNNNHNNNNNNNQKKKKKKKTTNRTCQSTPSGISESGSDHSKSVRGPLPGTSITRSIVRIWSIVLGVRTRQTRKTKKQEQTTIEETTSKKDKSQIKP